MGLHVRSVKIGANHAIPLSAVITVALIAISALLIFINNGSIKNQLNEWKLLPQPERLTELYFNDHAKLATTYTPDAPQSFGFTVHNLEYRQTEYNYVVEAISEDGSQRQPLAQSSLELAQDGYRSINISFVPQDLGKRVKIQVTLTYRSDKPVTESVHYWVTSTKQDEGAAL